MLGYGRRLVGRSQERDVLASSWNSARAGHGRIVVLAGEAGIGKTRLTQVVAERVCAGGGLVLCGRAVSNPASTPFRPFAEALCSAVRMMGLPDDAELIQFRHTLVPNGTHTVETRRRNPELKGYLVYPPRTTHCLFPAYSGPPPTASIP